MIKLSENIRTKVHDTGVGNGALQGDTQRTVNKRETRDSEHIKMKNSRASNHTSNRQKRNPFPLE